MLEIGKVGRPHGLRGAFFVSERDDTIPREYKRVFIGPNEGQAVEARVTASRMASGRPVIECSLSQDRTAAEALTGQLVFVEESLIPRDGRPLWRELEKAPVVASDGTEIGAIEHVYNAGASDIVQIRGRDGRTVDVALAPPYIELETAWREGKLHLSVIASVFEELWQ